MQPLRSVLQHHNSRTEPDDATVIRTKSGHSLRREADGLVGSDEAARRPGTRVGEMSRYGHKP
jgi:hypothetical protein